MAIEWDNESIGSMLARWTNAHAGRVASFARTNLPESVGLSREDATPEHPLALVVGGAESVRREYGDSNNDPSPWGWPALMEAATQGLR